MRFSKKLLAVLLPVAATSTLVPVLTSCNNGSSWDFSYGTTLNCLYSKPTSEQAKYHSLSAIKSAVKNHTAIEATQKVASIDVLPQWGLESSKQLMYFDLVAGVSVFNKTNFYLTWDVSASTPSIELIVKEQDEEKTYAGTKMKYVADSTTTTQINVAILNADDEEQFSVKSYDFQNTKIGA